MIFIFLITFLFVIAIHKFINSEIEHDTDKNIIFVKLNRNGDNPYYDKITDIELQIINKNNNNLDLENEDSDNDNASNDNTSNDNTSNDNTSSDNLSTDDNEISDDNSSNDDYLFINLRNSENISEQNDNLVNYLESNIPFDGKLLLVCYGEELDFLKNHIEKLNIWNNCNKILFKDSRNFVKKYVPPGQEENNSWWAVETTDSLYNYDNICNSQKINSDIKTVESHIELCKKICMDNNLNFYNYF